MLALGRLVVVFAAAVALCFATGCAPRQSGPGRLAAVAPLPAPSPPPFVASVAPVGEVGTLAQIRVRFRDDLIPLERLESPDEAAVLAQFSIEPALPGRFRFLTPRMIGFEAERAWPGATRVRVHIAKGLHDVHGRALDQDVTWTFATPAIALAELPGSADEREPLDVRPRLAFTANMALDRASLEAHAWVRADGERGDGTRLIVPADTATASPSPTPQPDEEFDPANHTWRYVLVPAAPLRKGTSYELVIEPGVLPRDGNRGSDQAFSGSFRTYDTLRFDGIATRPPGTRFVDGDPVLAFSTPIDEKSLDAIKLAPAPPPGVRAFGVVDGGVGIAPNVLAPNTAYTVTIGADLRDRFGQRLAQPQQATFETSDLVPDLWAPSGVSLFPAASDVRLHLYAVNETSGVRATFRALRPADVVQYPDPYGESDRGDVLPPSAQWPAFDASAPRNVERTIEVPLRAKLGAAGGVLAYGVAGPLRPNETFVASGVVQLTNLGVFAQWFPDGGLVRVNRIADGRPVGGAQVEIYPSQADAKEKTAPAACARGKTDANGVARFAAADFARCAARDGGENQAPAFVTIVRAGTDWTYVRSSDFNGAYAGDFFNGWSSATPLSRGTIFSDRELYQPGETAQLTAVGWFLTDGVLRRGTAPSYGLVLEMPNGRKRDLGRGALDAYGTFSFPVALPKDAPLGVYLVRASAGNGEQLIGDFRLAEFKPPNFKVDLALDRTVARRGETVGGTATSAYLFGAPLTGASTAFTVTRSPSDFTPKGRDDYTFGRRWFWPEEPPDAATDVLQTTASVDENGKSAVRVSVAGDLPYPMQYEVDAETTDASNIAVADSKTFTALPSETLIGLRADDVGTAGTPLAVATLATDPSGAARVGTAIHLELQAANYASATQIVEGAEQAVQSVTYATVASIDVTSASAPVSASLTPPKPGTYRLRATLAGASDGAAETDDQVFVGGSGETAWYARDPNLLTVKLDKATYAPGATATVLVQSPFPNAELHVLVVRHGVMWETTQLTTSAAPTVRFTVTPAMLPNAVVEAFAVRRGAPPKTNPGDSGNALARVGFAPFDVALGGKYVAVTVRADAGVLAPGGKQTVRIHLTDAAGRPLRAQATLIVANDAVLALTGYRPPDLVKTVYADQPISTRYADNRSALVLASPERPQEKGWGYGGGLSGEEADPRVRRRFSPLAYFAGALRTDEHGDASASFTLPDDLTTWRAMVVAASADGRFGNGEATFRTTLPLVANPAFPQFARPGDTFEGGVAVTNGTGAQGTLHVDASLAGPLAFLVDRKQQPTTLLEAPLERITRAYRFPIVATGAGGATATVRVAAAGAADAFAVPLPVRDLDVSEAVAQTGSTQARASVPLEVAAGTPRDAGGLDLVLAPSLIPEIGVAADAALRGDERLALSAASRLAVASDLAILVARNGGDPRAARARAAQEIAALRDLRRADGGFAAYWRAEGSSAWDSLPALAALARAREAQVPIDDALLDGAR
ncbi:MAG TPA: alpha-2-macroglobulin family protein, partial [Candidatus Limnocylindria bacterium]|nr:alpha-2-macroglobulin family protein [Candidatus Limnocylindria bacterium]